MSAANQHVHGAPAAAARRLGRPDRPQGYCALHFSCQQGRCPRPAATAARRRRRARNAAGETSLLLSAASQQDRTAVIAAARAAPILRRSLAKGWTAILRMPGGRASAVSALLHAGARRGEGERRATRGRCVHRGAAEAEAIRAAWKAADGEARSSEGGGAAER